MPAPAMSSRHLYPGTVGATYRQSEGPPWRALGTTHRSRFRCHRCFVSMRRGSPCSSSHRTPAPLRRVGRSVHHPALDRCRRCLESPPVRLPPSLAQHGSRTHVGAGNSAVVVDLSLCGPMLSPRVPHHVSIPGPRMERETPGQRPRPNYGHPHPEADMTT